MTAKLFNNFPQLDFFINMCKNSLVKILSPNIYRLITKLVTIY